MAEPPYSNNLGEGIGEPSPLPHTCWMNELNKLVIPRERFLSVAARVPRRVSFEKNTTWSRNWGGQGVIHVGNSEWPSFLFRTLARSAWSGTASLSRLAAPSPPRLRQSSIHVYSPRGVVRAAPCPGLTQGRPSAHLTEIRQAIGRSGRSTAIAGFCAGNMEFARVNPKPSVRDNPCLGSDAGMRS